MDMNADLIAQAASFLAAVKSFNGDAVEQCSMEALMQQWETSQVIAAMNLFVELEVLEHISKQGRIGSKELAEIVKVDESAIGFIYLKGGADEFFKFMIDQTGPFLRLPRYFQTHEKKDLYDLKKSPYAWVVGLEGKDYYEAISSNPKKLHNFNFTMATSESVTPILGMFPWASLKAQVQEEPERAFAVDIGEGRGQLLKKIQEAPGGFGAKMILQDRPDVLDSVAAEDIGGIEKMPYDFFKEQPVKSIPICYRFELFCLVNCRRHAHVYLMRRILHDFYAPVCIEPVKNVAAAMGPTSRFIITDLLMPEKVEVGAEMTPYWMDFNCGGCPAAPHPKSN
ncbi:hypothetical protein BP6252_06681 [Coleophoma cylindrospora]|uniref:O-methyltransferase domain-containing protein n=1 Tax=Coleophoma cylindrospora TaxID=1849047 RepID=A0A3D8RNA5_9HELO|nr:hypothetical protein BP6252_06681 [Coleophoma cylindrospora]